MSTPQPENFARPDFAVVVRGYDRAQVDAYFGRALEWLADADTRVAVAEREREQLARQVSELRATVAMLEDRAGLPAPQSMNEFSDRIGQLMQNAMEAAHELQAQADREARERKEAMARQADRLVEDAQAEADRILQGARENQRAVEESISDLRAARKDAHTQLAELHRQIADVLAMPAPEERPVSLTPDGGLDEALDGGVGGLPLEGDELEGDGSEGDVSEGDVSEAPGSEGDEERATAGDSVLETPAPTTVQEAVEAVESVATAALRAHDVESAGSEPTIVQPAVGGKRPSAKAGRDTTLEQPAVPSRR